MSDRQYEHGFLRLDDAVQDDVLVHDEAPERVVSGRSPGWR
jgi:hypothetical protein